MPNAALAPSTAEAGAPAPEDWGDAERVYRTLLVVQWTENGLNFVLSLYFVYRISHTALIHPNMRILLLNMVLPYNLAMGARMCALWNESEWRVSGNSRLVTNLICLVSRFVLSVAICPCAISILALAIERLLATIFRHTYEIRGTTFAVALNIFTYSCAALYSAGSIMTELRDGFDVATDTRSCINDELHPIVLVRFWVIAGVTCYAGLLLFLVVYRWNVHLTARERWSEGPGTLQVRFQHRQNMTTASALAPGVVPYALLVLAGVALALHTAMHYDLGQPVTSISVRVNFQILYMIMDVYVIAFQLLFLCQYPPLRNQLRRDVYGVLCCGRATNVGGGRLRIGVPPLPSVAANAADAKTVGALYFKQLNDEWAAPRDR